MTQEQKATIQQSLQNFVSGFPSQKHAANTLKECSEATVVNILNGKWNDISDKMWLNIASQIDRKVITGPVVETTNFMTLILYFTIAKENGATFAMSGGAGFGKTFAGKWFAGVKRNVFYLECAEWNKKMFLINMLQAMGKNYFGMNIYEMMHAIVYELRRVQQPLFILDEIDKLPDPAFKFFITLYNELDGSCGFVWTSTDNMEKRMKKGLNANRNGYQELFSRIGQRFIFLPEASHEDISEMCRANGITNVEDISRVANECKGDLRRVKRNFLKEKVRHTRKSLKIAS